MRLLDGGLTQAQVARRLGVHQSAVHRWREALEREGPRGLDPRPHPGPKPKLTDTQRQALTLLLLRGARAHGWKSDLWTTQRIADLIERRFGVSYHRDHVGRLLRRLGWSVQRPTRRAKQRDEQAIAQWVKTDWPRIKKTPAAKGRTSSSSTRAASR